MKKDIKSLKELQAIDIEIKKFDDEIAAGDKDLNNRRQSIEALKVEIGNLREKSALLEARRREIEAEVEDVLAKIKDRQSKLMNVQTNREYQSLLKEIEDNKKANRGREDELVLIMERSESLNRDIEEKDNVCGAEEKLLDEEMKKADKNNATINSKKAKIAEKREKKAQKVSVRGLKKYEMLRMKRNGLAVVGVKNGVCLGCHLNIPPQLFNNLIKNDELLSCPTCNRMMFYEPDTEEK